MNKKFSKMAIVLSILLLCMASMSTVFGKEDATEKQNELIYEYVNNINNGKIENVIPLLHNSMKEEYNEFILDKQNKNKHIGLYNYKSATIVSINEYDGTIEELGCANNYENILKINIFECIIDVDVYTDSNYLVSGENKFIFVLGLNEQSKYVILEILRDRLWSENHKETSGYISGYSYDAPVGAPSLGVWKTPSTIRVQSYGTVDFKDYCYIVTANEFGTDSYNDNARKAVALSVKNYGWHRTLVQKYPNLGYDVKPSTADQMYNPSKTVSSKVRTAVDNIWNYVMLSCDNRLFCSFYAKNIGINNCARKNGGILSQEEANSLGNSGYSWQSILHYFYDYGQYNTEMTRGVIKIISLSHSPSGSYGYDSKYHWILCNTCGCIHTKTVHSWASAIGGGYECRICGAVKLSVARNMLFFDTIVKE